MATHFRPAIEITASIKTRFRKFYKKTKGCWNWIGAIGTGMGYGHFQITGKRQSGKGRGFAHQAHRVAFQIKYGPIPDGIFVLHTCDNPRCVNPSHLFLGTHKDNMRDKKTKGRAIQFAERGSDRYNAKLNEDSVREIKKLLPTKGDSYLSRQFGVSRMAIYLIRTRQRWTHV